MAQHPIEGLMTTAMESIKEMVDVNTIVGDAVQAPDGTVIIPISRVTFGFTAGGGEYGKSRTERSKTGYDDDDDEVHGKYPFAGGSGAGVSIHPVAFMVVGNGQIRLLPVNLNSSLDKIIDLIPDLVRKLNETVRKKIIIKKDLSSKTNEKEENNT
jgi:sporulation protein YtfJ